MKVYLASEKSQEGGYAAVSSMSLSHWAKDKPRSMHESGTMFPAAFNSNCSNHLCRSAFSRHRGVGGGFFASSEFHTPVDGVNLRQATDDPLPEQSCGCLGLRTNPVSRSWYRDMIRGMSGWTRLQ